MRSVYSPGFQAIRENLHKLGKIRRVSFQYCQYSRRYDNFKKGIIENAFNPALSNGALMDIGVYCVHPLVSLFGKPEKVISSSLKLSNGIDGAGTILTEYPDFQGELLYSKITDSRVPSQIQGEEGSLVIREIPDPQEVVLYYRDGSNETLEIPRTENNMVYEIREFLRLIREKRYSHEYLENSQMEIELMDEVRRQIKNRKRHENLKKILRRFFFNEAGKFLKSPQVLQNPGNRREKREYTVKEYFCLRRIYGRNKK